MGPRVFLLSSGTLIATIVVVVSAWMLNQMLSLNCELGWYNGLSIAMISFASLHFIFTISIVPCCKGGWLAFLGVIYILNGCLLITYIVFTSKCLNPLIESVSEHLNELTPIEIDEFERENNCYKFNSIKRQDCKSVIYKDVIFHLFIAGVTLSFAECMEVMVALLSFKMFFKSRKLM